MNVKVCLIYVHKHNAHIQAGPNSEKGITKGGFLWENYPVVSVKRVGVAGRAGTWGPHSEIHPAQRERPKIKCALDGVIVRGGPMSRGPLGALENGHASYTLGPQDEDSTGALVRGWGQCLTLQDACLDSTAWEWRLRRQKRWEYLRIELILDSVCLIKIIQTKLEDNGPEYSNQINLYNRGTKNFRLEPNLRFKGVKKKTNKIQ